MHTRNRFNLKSMAIAGSLVSLLGMAVQDAVAERVRGGSAPTSVRTTAPSSVRASRSVNANKNTNVNANKNVNVNTSDNVNVNRNVNANNVNINNVHVDHDDDWDSGGAFVAGAVIGTMTGAAIASASQPTTVVVTTPPSAPW